MNALAIRTPKLVTVPPLSQSKFELMACPHLYVERIVHGKKEPDNEYSLRGSQQHEGAAHYVDYLIQQRKPADLPWFTENIMTRPYLADALEILEHMGESMVIDPERILDTELWLPLDEDLNPLDVEPGHEAVAYEGTLDLVQLPTPTSALIEDYKTYFQIVDADTFQSKLYPLLVFKHFEQIQEVTFRLRFVRYGKAFREVVYTRADVPKLETQVVYARNRQIALHKDAAGDATPGAHCAYCPKLRHGCPISMINPYTTETPEDRVRFGVWIQQAKKENDRILKDLVRISGPIKVEDANGTPYEATFNLIPETSYPAIPCLSIVSANDPDLAPKLTLSELSDALKAKKRAGLVELVAEHKQVKESTRFYITECD